ncbi:DUF3157 family protein [uncultured Photobacterium sp.]|uniref:DUF3157 family protein n=1 Tax=uncultured Photobacterium sp. TaxID=173973 RepID=UPI00262DA912|nr:DUF3157 family protein [uncultured Photobacterium sp.]
MRKLNRICSALPKLLIGFTMTAMTSSALAVPKVATLEDGRQVILHDDFSWQYVVPVEQRQHPVSEPSSIDAETTPASLSSPTVTAAPVVVTAIPVVTSVQGIKFVPGANKNIQQLSRSGVDVLLRPATYRDGELMIPTSLTNQSSESVILVELQVRIHDDKGQELASQQEKIWTSVKRMPETYFRPKTQQEGKPLKISLPEADSYYIEAEIVEVEHW